MGSSGWIVDEGSLAKGAIGMSGCVSRKASTNQCGRACLAIFLEPRQAVARLVSLQGSPQLLL